MPDLPPQPPAAPPIDPLPGSPSRFYIPAPASPGYFPNLPPPPPPRSANFEPVIGLLYLCLIVRDILAAAFWQLYASTPDARFFSWLPLLSMVGSGLALAGLFRPQLKPYSLAGAGLAIAGAVYPPLFQPWPLGFGAIVMASLAFMLLVLNFDEPHSKIRAYGPYTPQGPVLLPSAAPPPGQPPWQP